MRQVRRRLLHSAIRRVPPTDRRDRAPDVDAGDDGVEGIRVLAGDHLVRFGDTADAVGGGDDDGRGGEMTAILAGVLLEHFSFCAPVDGETSCRGCTDSDEVAP